MSNENQKIITTVQIYQRPTCYDLLTGKHRNKINHDATLSKYKPIHGDTKKHAQRLKIKFIPETATCNNHVG